MIYDVRKGVKTCFRKLKPGGVLLVTVPGITPVDQGTWRDTWYWGFTTTAIDRLLGEVFEREMFEVDYYGNVYAATAFLYGMGAPEVSKKMLDRKDPSYPVIICAKARKPQ